MILQGSSVQAGGPALLAPSNPPLGPIHLPISGLWSISGLCYSSSCSCTSAPAPAALDHHPSARSNTPRCTPPNPPPLPSPPSLPRQSSINHSPPKRTARHAGSRRCHMVPHFVLNFHRPERAMCGTVSTRILIPVELHLAAPSTQPRSLAA